jgi:hypothetical protein
MKNTLVKSHHSGDTCKGGGSHVASSYIDFPNRYYQAVRMALLKSVRLSLWRPGFDSRPGRFTPGTSRLGWRWPWSSLLIFLTFLGMLEDDLSVTALLHAYGALACWDYATAAPYVNIDLNPKVGSWFLIPGFTGSELGPWWSCTYWLVPCIVWLISFIISPMQRSAIQLIFLECYGRGLDYWSFSLKWNLILCWGIHSTDSDL